MSSVPRPPGPALPSGHGDPPTRRQRAPPRSRRLRARGRRGDRQGEPRGALPSSGRITVTGG